MTTSSSPAGRPPAALLAAMERLRANDSAGALALAEAALTGADDRLPFLALAGMAALRSGAPHRAIPHLRALLEIRPDDKASQFNLANALIETGNLDDALALAQRCDGPQFARIEGYVHQQREADETAIEAYRRAVTGDPADLASWNNLANLLIRRNDVDGAIRAYERAIALSPHDVGLYLNLAEAQRHADLGPARLKTMRAARRLAPDDRRVLTELALAQSHAGDLEGAVETLEGVVACYPEFGESHLELGRLYEVLNRLDDLARFLAGIDLASAGPEATYLMAWLALREGRFDDAASIAKTIPGTINPMRRLHLAGQIADRRGNHEAAFSAFEQMNSAALADSAHSGSNAFRLRVEADMARLPSQAGVAQPGTVEDGQRDPVFLVGFPRSGTTLLDTMLMGQPELCVLEERPMMATVAHRNDNTDPTTLPLDQMAELRAAYFRVARSYGWDGTRWLVDKHPLNMARAPLIHRLFPNARFILVERHPYDVVLSTFMANFQLNEAMRSFTSLDEAARTYDAVFSIWDRSRELFALAAHPIRYERLVEDTQGELAPLVDWLGLKWDARVLDHQETARSRGIVRTASYAQIGEQLYTRARYRWRRYAEQIAPVIPILRPWAQRLGYETE